MNTPKTKKTKTSKFSQFFYTFLLHPLLILGSLSTLPQSTVAQPNPITAARQQINSRSLNLKQFHRTFSSSDKAFSQVNSVSALKDIEPTDWAYEALRSLVERYGCLKGYPDLTYRGNHPLSREQFAAGLNACLNTIESLMQENVAVLREDIEKIKRLAQEFESELTALGARIDNLEARVSFLEDHQFSTTSKLFAQVIWSIDEAFGDKIGEDQDESQMRMAYRIRLNQETSFTGKDILRTRFEINTFRPLNLTTGTNMTRFSYDNNSGSPNFRESQVHIPHLWYRTPLGSDVTLTVGTVGIGYIDLLSTFAPPTVNDESRGIPSLFGEYSPVYRRGGGGGGINWDMTKNLQLSLAYVGGDPNDPQQGKGLFNGTYHTIAQLALSLEKGQVGFAYSRSYFPAGRTDLMGGTGSLLAIQPFGNNIATSGDFYTLQGYYQITPNVQIHGWGGYVDSIAQSSAISNISNGVGDLIPTFVNRGNHASIAYGAIGLSFPDLTGENHLPGILIGIPPKVTASNVRSPQLLGRGQDTAYHIEAFYRIPLNENINITPGFWAIVNPEHNNFNETQWVGHIRTGFNF
ncbi:iron uptake porin [Crocosphaera sp.]|uniref:iron uptake porin n=1 Tax=Crocosphaera sp. TaxID=2729996 RepID=UPI003F27E070|nr:iron uptake porin [Crocosphaera sp.]